LYVIILNKKLGTKNNFALHYLKKHRQRCQMAYFLTKNPNLGKFWRAWEWKMLVYFIAFGIFDGH
jgi:hypothetical protein